MSCEYITWDAGDDKVGIFQNIMERCPFIYFDPFRSSWWKPEITNKIVMLKDIETMVKPWKSSTMSQKRFMNCI